MRRWAVAMLLALAACGDGAALDGLADAGSARARQALTGDQIVADDGRTIALAGVAAPPPGAPHASQARQALQTLVGGVAVRLSSDGAPDGPVHARVGRRWVQGELLEAGAVRVRTDAGHRALASEMLRAEDRARRAGRGLWALPSYQVRLPREVVSSGDEGFQIVEGRVFRAAETAGRVYLEFGAQWRGGFSTETPLDALSRFESGGVDLRTLQGRLIRVRGDVRPTRYGPRLRLDHPEQIEMLADDRR